MNFVYPRWHVDAASIFWWLPTLAAFVVTAALWWKRQTIWGRPLLFAWLFYCAALVPVLGFTDVYFMRYSLVADHYQYIALIAVAALAASAIARLHSRLPFSSPPTVYRRLPTCLIGLLLAALTVLSWQQSQMYRNPITLWQTTLEKNPDCPLAHTNLGREMQKIGQLPEAIEHYQAAIQADPNFAEAHCGLGSCAGRHRTN